MRRASLSTIRGLATVTFLIASLTPCDVEGFGESKLPRRFLLDVRARAASESRDTASTLFDEAARLRAEVDALEADEDLPASAGIVDGKTRKDARKEAELQALRRLTVNLPISKPDFSVVDEDVEFVPALPLGTSELIKLSAPLPLGLILEQGGYNCVTNDSMVAVSAEFTWVAEVAEGSNAEAAGVQEGDILRACSAVKIQMEMPTWQLLGGGIGRPRPFRFIYSADRRPFEEVMEAVGSNRMDPEARDALLVLERPLSGQSSSPVQ